VGLYPLGPATVFASIWTKMSAIERPVSTMDGL
jgi:hypothetical protein